MKKKELLRRIQTLEFQVRYLEQKLNAKPKYHYIKPTND